MTGADELFTERSAVFREEGQDRIRFCRTHRNAKSSAAVKGRDVPSGPLTLQFYC